MSVSAGFDRSPRLMRELDVPSDIPFDYGRGRVEAMRAQRSARASEHATESFHCCTNTTCLFGCRLQMFVGFGTFSMQVTQGELRSDHLCRSQRGKEVAIPQAEQEISTTLVSRSFREACWRIYLWSGPTRLRSFSNNVPGPASSLTIPDAAGRKRALRMTFFSSGVIAAFSSLRRAR